MRTKERRFNTDRQGQVFSCIVYSDISRIEEYQQQSNLSKWAYAYHNKDTRLDENGNIVPKEPHYHLLLAFAFDMTEKQVADSLDTFFGQSSKVEVCDDLQGSYSYLIHKNSPSKHQYDKSVRKTNDWRFWCRETQEKKNCKVDDTQQFIDDLLDGKKSIVEMARQYGRDYIKNMSKYTDFKRAVALENQLDFQFLDNIEYRAYRICKESGDVLSSADGIDPKYLNSSVFALALKIAQEVLQNNKIQIGGLTK